MQLNVKPVLTYGVHHRAEATSWRPWGGIQTENDAQEEVARIEGELADLARRAPFGLQIGPLSAVKSLTELPHLEDELHAADVTLIYAAGGHQDLLNAIIEASKWPIIFLRHRSGPLYLWYEIAHPILLRDHSDEFVQPKLGVDDVVVDSYDELAWRLRALYGLKNTLNSRIVCIGGPSGWGGWGKGIGGRAPTHAQETWGIDMMTVPYSDLETRITAAMADDGLVEQARQQAEAYVAQEGVTLHTERAFVDNAFLLHHVFRDLMAEHDATSITVNECMSTIIPIAKTTACLTLSLINDEGDLAFCESDFVVIPSGMLLHHISGTPVFLNDPTYPYDGIVTVAHCTAPSKMNGQSPEPAKIVTHFESDYGAAPKVEFQVGQQVTMVIPNFHGDAWVTFEGTIAEVPFLPTCRSQADVQIQGDWRQLLREMQGFHWMMGYGDYQQEIGYALKKVGIAHKPIDA
jgi:L-fucose isomerase-like protein